MRYFTFTTLQAVRLFVLQFMLRFVMQFILLGGIIIILVACSEEEQQAAPNSPPNSPEPSSQQFGTEMRIDMDSDNDGIANAYDSSPYEKGIAGSGDSLAPFQITNIYQLQAIAGFDHTGTPLSSSIFTNGSYLYGDDVTQQLSAFYLLINDIDAAITRNWNPTSNDDNEETAAGFIPIGNCTDSSCLSLQSNAFSGQFYGSSHKIKNLFINRPNTDQIGLWGAIGKQAKIDRVSLEDVNIVGRDMTGSLAGFNLGGSILMASASGRVAGQNQVGGIIGRSLGNITGAYTSGTIYGRESIGGIAGQASGTINSIYSIAKVSGRDNIGGLIGESAADISIGYSTGNITGTNRVGGIIGTQIQGSIINTYSVSRVTGESAVGGLVGKQQGIIVASYSANQVTGQSSIGMISGLGYGSIISSYWLNSNEYIIHPITGNSALIPAHHFSQPMRKSQLGNCALDGMVIAAYSTPRVCHGNSNTLLFPSDYWSHSINGDMQRGWIFSPNDKYPVLFSSNIISFENFMPRIDEQFCHIAKRENCRNDEIDRSPIFTTANYKFNLELNSSPLNSSPLDSSPLDGTIVGRVDAYDEVSVIYGILAPINYPFEIETNTGNIIVKTTPEQNNFPYRFIVTAFEYIGNKFATSSVTISANTPSIADNDNDGIINIYDNMPNTAGINGTGSTQDPYPIKNIYQLQAIGGIDHQGTALPDSDLIGNAYIYGDNLTEQLSKNYIIVNDIDASVTAYWNTLIDGDSAKGFMPIGRCGDNGCQDVSSRISFTGSLTGSSPGSSTGSSTGSTFRIFNLYINRPQVSGVALFASVGNGSVLSSINIEQATINGYKYNGILAGYQGTGGIIQFSNTQGIVQGADNSGGLVGLNQGSIISSYSIANILGSGNQIGGLVGQQSVEGNITNSYAMGGVSGRSEVGGLVGKNAGEIDGSYATSVVTPTAKTLENILADIPKNMEGTNEINLIDSLNRNDRTTFGGLVGLDSSGIVNASYWARDLMDSSNLMDSSDLMDSIDSSNIHISASGIAISRQQLSDCALGGIQIEPSDVSCENNGKQIFPYSSWGNRTYSGVRGESIQSSWVFTPVNKYPRLLIE